MARISYTQRPSVEVAGKDTIVIKAPGLAMHMRRNESERILRELIAACRQLNDAATIAAISRALDTKDTE